MPAKFSSVAGVWSWQIADKDQPAGTVRVRWVFPASKEPLVVNALSAYQPRRVEDGELARGVRSNRRRARISLLPSTTALSCPSKETPSTPRRLKVRYSEPTPQKVDRTTLRFHLPEQTVCVAVEDVVAHGCVYVPSAGLFVTTDPPRTTLAQYLQEIAGKKTVLEEVRQLPDQTFSQAMAITHNPIQNFGPMLASLACDNRKFMVERDGTIHFPSLRRARHDRRRRVARSAADVPPFQLTPRFGDGKGEVKRHLDGGWLPKPVTTVTENGLECRQCIYVAPLDEKAARRLPELVPAAGRVRVPSSRSRTRRPRRPTSRSR